MRQRFDHHGDPLPLHAVARLGTMRLRHVELIHLAFSADGKALASSGGGVVRLWRVSDGRLLKEIGRGHLFAAMRAGDRFLALELDEDRVWWYDVVADKRAGRLKMPEGGLSTISSDRKTAARLTFQSEEEGVLLHDLAKGKSAGAIMSDKFLPLTACFTRDGKSLWTGDTTGEGGHLRLWDVATRKAARVLPAGRGAAYILAVSDDGKTLAVGHATPNYFDDGDQKQTAVTLRDAITGKELHVLSRHGPRTRSLAFSPDGKSVAVGRAGTIELYDVRTGKALHQAPGHGAGVHAVAFRASGREAVTAGKDWTVRIWSAAGKPLGVTDLIADVPKAVDLSPDGTHLTWADQAGKLTVRDLLTGKDRVAGIRESRSPDLALSYDNRTLAVWSSHNGGEGPASGTLLVRSHSLSRRRMTTPPGSRSRTTEGVSPSAGTSPSRCTTR